MTPKRYGGGVVMPRLNILRQRFVFETCNPAEDIGKVTWQAVGVIDRVKDFVSVDRGSFHASIQSGTLQNSN